MKKAICAVGVTFLLVTFAVTGCGGGEGELPEGGVFKLRSQYKVMSEEDVKSMLKARDFYDRRWRRSGGFPNRFELKTVGEHKVVVDRASNLTWHQSGSELPLIFEDVKPWLETLNRERYAGYTDWRLPTLEEALTLMEKKPVDRFHIDPLFSTQQYSMWSGDYYTEVRVWGVSFNYGRVFKVLLGETDFIRPVRSGVD